MACYAARQQRLPRLVCEGHQRRHQKAWKASPRTVLFGPQARLGDTLLGLRVKWPIWGTNYFELESKAVFGKN